MTIPRPLAALAAALILAGCSGAPRAAPAPVPATPAPPVLEAVTWTRASSPDSIAAWAMRGCGAAVEEKQACYERALVSALQPAGVDRVMAALDRISAADAGVARQGHVFAHGIGIAAYAGESTVSETFAKCTPAYQSGCYHGVIQAFFADAGAGGATAERLNALCAEYRTAAGRWLQFQCAHGAGHGLMAVHGQHLLRALDACDLLTNPAEREGCWGGAFMENVVNATHPHHTATTQLASGDGHAGMDHGGEHAAPGAQPAGHDHGAMQHEAFRALDDAEPLYPCTVVAEQHRPSCYLMQTSAILYRNGGDFAGAAEQCGRAPERYRRACFTSLGRDAAAYSRGDDPRAAELCGGATDAGRPWCAVGVVKNRIDVTADPADGFPFCRAVAGADVKRACYRAIGEQAALLLPSAPDRERTCTAVEDGFLEECRSGALLPRRQS